VRLVVVGKGGAGKSVIAATLARTLARRGRRVLALDSDPLPGLSYSLGVEPPDVPPLLAATERRDDKRWHFVAGVGPARAVQRFAIDAPDGVRLLQIGKTTREGMAPVIGASHAFFKTIHGLDRVASLRDWDIVGDLPAGPRQVAFEWAPYARQFLLVVEPTWQSMLTCRRIARVIAGTHPEAELALVVNKATGPQDAKRVAEVLGRRVVQVVPVDEGVRSAERAGVALLDHAPGSAAVGAIERLADHLERSTVGA
jgi:CO dehydrogenase maturation factor